MRDERPRSGRTGAIGLELLGVRVRLAVEDEELRARLEACYGRSRAPEAPEVERSLAGALAREGDGWRVAVDGRDDVRAADEASAVRVLNHELLHALMARARELYYVHAAVVRAGGAGVVLPGLSQAGKSTLALALVLSGAGYLSDEILAYDPSARVARAFPRAPKIRDVCVPYFRELAPRFVGAGEARFLPFDALPPAARADSAAVGAIVVPRWDARAGGARLEPLGAGATLLALVESSLNFGAHRAASLDHLAALVHGARAFRIAWSEPHAAARAILHALGSAPAGGARAAGP